MAGNHTLIKKYTDNYYCVMQLKSKKSDGVLRLSADMLDESSDNEDIGNDTFGNDKLADDENTQKKHNEKFRESLVRSRTNIFEIAMCNGFDIFATCTISPEKYDRYHLKEYYKDFGQYIANLK